MEKTIKEKIIDLINSNQTKESIYEILSSENVKKETIRWYYNKLKNKTNETNK